MKIVGLFNIVSEHQLPLAREIVRLVGADHYRYVYLERNYAERERLGWKSEPLPEWCIPFKGNERIVEDAEFLYTGERFFDLFERRRKRDKITAYYSERWFKPIGVFPGTIRMLVPKYRKMARRFVTWLNDDPRAYWLTVGPWARRDALSLGVGQDRLVPWGYFIQPDLAGEADDLARSADDGLKILWVGRLLNWKRVKDIVRAVGVCKARFERLPVRRSVSLDIYGYGPEELRLKRMVARFGLDKQIHFYSPVPMPVVRQLMRVHDLYVLASNEEEGWGAVVSEALTEGMRVIGTFEAGSSATILPSSNLYHSGDWRRLGEMLVEGVPFAGLGDWTAAHAAHRILTMSKVTVNNKQKEVQL